MTRFQVDSEEMFVAASAVRSAIGRIQSEVAGLHGQLVNLQGTWTGQASSAFGGVISEWRMTQQRVEENLAAINQALGHAGQQYADIEATNARLFLGR